MTNENENIIESGWQWSIDGFYYDSDVFATSEAAIEDTRQKIEPMTATVEEVQS